jgi:hypothetical protein
MVNSVIHATLALSGLFTAFLVSYWTMKAFELKQAVISARVEQSRYKKAA